MKFITTYEQIVRAKWPILELKNEASNRVLKPPSGSSNVHLSPTPTTNRFKTPILNTQLNDMAFSGMLQNATRTQFGRCNHARNICNTYSTLETLEDNT